MNAVTDIMLNILFGDFVCIHCGRHSRREKYGLCQTCWTTWLHEPVANRKRADAKRGERMPREALEAINNYLDHMVNGKKYL